MKDSVENQILAQAFEMFTRFGLRSVTMDDLATELGVSKKTLYNHISNKKELVQRTVQFIFHQIEEHLDEAMSAGENAIEVAFRVDKMMCRHAEQHNHSMQFQLQKYYPEILQWLNEKRRASIFERMRRNIKRGKAEGLYRPELDEEIIITFYYVRMTHLAQHRDPIFEQYSFREITREILIYHLRGMATPRGLAVMEAILENEKQTQA